MKNSRDKSSRAERSLPAASLWQAGNFILEIKMKSEIASPAQKDERDRNDDENSFSATC